MITWIFGNTGAGKTTLAKGMVKKITNCKFIYVEGGKEGEDYPFEKPDIYNVSSEVGLNTT